MSTQTTTNNGKPQAQPAPRPEVSAAVAAASAKAKVPLTDEQSRLVAHTDSAALKTVRRYAQSPKARKPKTRFAFRNGVKFQTSGIPAGDDPVSLATLIVSADKVQAAAPKSGQFGQSTSVQAAQIDVAVDVLGEAGIDIDWLDSDSELVKAIVE